MPENASGAVNATINGRSYSMDITAAADLKGGMSPSLAAAKAGTLTGRTDNDTGVATLGAGHGVVSTNKVGVYWDGGSRRNMTATVAGNDVTVDGGLGDNLPVLTTPLTVMVEDVETVTLAGDNLAALGVYSPNYPATVVFRQSDGTEIFAVQLDAGESYVWSRTSAVTNPLAGATVGKVTLSHGSSAGSSTIYVDWIND